jgi:DsbC/DsbD-like thiol-disulfide interchange protein
MRLSWLHLALVSLIAVAVPAAAVSRMASDEPKNPHAAADATHLHVELLVPENSLVKGTKPNPAGLYFKLEPGWHIYWKNAGDSGEPPHVKWTLPEGISTSPLQFPAPKRLPLGPLMDFGYENEVVFPFSFEVGRMAKSGPTDLHAKVDWLVCREVCIPGKAKRVGSSCELARVGLRCGAYQAIRSANPQITSVGLQGRLSTRGSWLSPRRYDRSARDGRRVFSGRSECPR